MTDLRWPTQVRGKSSKAARAASWLNRLLDACEMGTIVDVKVIGGSGKMVQRPEGTTLIIDPKVSAAESTPMHPFKIYQPTNFASFATGITFLDPTSGVGTVCNIDATVPTNFASVPPTVNPLTDDWRFWAVRSGYVEIRPVYSIPYGDASPDGIVIGYNQQVFTGSDGISAEVTNQPFDDPTTETLFPPLILNGDLSVESSASYLFWIKIIPDTNGSEYTNVKIAISKIGVGGFYTASQTPTMIPIGSLVLTFNENFGVVKLPYIVAQQLFDNVQFRFPVGNGNFGGGGVMNFRGIWDSVNDTTAPADLKDQVFYPGDLITIIGSPAGGNSIYQLMDNYPVMWDIPGGPPSSGAWEMILGAKQI